MNLDNIPYSDFEEYKVAKPVDLRERINQMLYHWPLFILSIGICLALAFVYLKFSSPVYSVKAKLLIKDGANTENTLSERDLFKGVKMIENEIEILKSKTLMEQVVRDLQLWINYEVVGDFRMENLYGGTPVIFTLVAPAQALSGQVIEFKIIDEHSFLLKQPNSEAKVSFSSQFKNQYGIWKLNPTNDLKNYIGRTIRISLNDPVAVTHNYLGAVNAVISREQSTVVDLSIRDQVLARAEDVIDRLIVVYNNAAITDKNKVAESTLRFIEDRLASITGELVAVEKDVEGYKSSRGLTDISSKSQIYLDNVQNNDAKINEVQMQMQVVNEIERYIKSSDNSDLAPATVGITDPVLLGLIDKLMNLESQKDKMLATIPEGNPVFQPINRQINSTKKAIDENIKGIKSALRVTQNQLNNFNSSFKASIREIPGQEREYISIKRQQSIKEDLYIYLLQKREEAAVSYASTISQNRIVDSAYSVGQESVSKPNTYALALILGLILPASFIYVRNFLNNRVLSKKEIQSSISVPILAELSYQASNGGLVIQNTPGKLIAEQFRSLRTNLIYAHGKKEGGRITLLTSGMPGDGKSFVTSNLGLTLAKAGRKTVILELDFRKPTILKSFNLESTKGLSDYLIGQAEKEEIVQNYAACPNLYIIGTGEVPPNPSELLEQPEMEELMDWLRWNFDEILIDTPPILLVTDAMIVARYSDVNLYVIRQGYTHKSQLESVNQLWKEHKLEKLNIVFNGVNNKSVNYKYGYYSQEEKPGLVENIQGFLHRF